MHSLAVVVCPSKPSIHARCFERYRGRVVFERRGEKGRIAFRRLNGHIVAMNDTHIIRARVTEETYRTVASIARQQQLTESAWLRRLIETTLQSAGVTAETLSAEDAEKSPRQSRLSVRLLPDDDELLQARAKARGIPTATYASVIIRAHVRRLAPLLREERALLHQAINELGAIGRNLNQLARAANQGSPATVKREELRVLLRACEGLRDHVRGLLEANMKSWESGRD